MGLRDIIQKALSQVPLKKSPVELPERFSVLTLEQLQNLHILDEIAEAYQEIFGAADFWGEGAFCNKEGWSRLITLDDFKARTKLGSLKCECGGFFEPCYPSEGLKKRIARELSASEKENPVFVLMNGDEDRRVGGFAWGVVSTLDVVIKRILESRYVGIKREQGLKEMELLREKLKGFNISPQKKILFGDEIGVVSRFRVGLEPILFLARVWLEHGFNNGCRQVLFWTSSKSPVFNLALFIGFQKVHITTDNVAFIFNPDISLLMKVLQYSGESEFKDFLVNSARMLKDTKG